MFLRCDGRSLLGKKGTAGIHCVKTGKAVLVAVYDQPITPGQCSVVVEKVSVCFSVVVLGRSLSPAR